MFALKDLNIEMLLRLLIIVAIVVDCRIIRIISQSLKTVKRLMMLELPSSNHLLSPCFIIALAIEVHLHYFLVGLLLNASNLFIFVISPSGNIRLSLPVPSLY